MNGLKERIYVCHTFYHVYISCLKELELSEKTGKSSLRKADLVLSKMSNDFGNLKERAEKSGLFGAVYEFDEKEESFFPELKKYHTDRGNLLFNMLSRFKFTKLYGKLQEPFVPVDFRQYRDIYVFCDSDPIGYYLSYKKIYYHAVEDGLNCLETYDTARYDNRGHFELKAFLASKNLIFIQNGWGKYCLDMEVNDISILPYPCPKYIEKPRKELTDRLTEEDKLCLLSVFLEDRDGLLSQLSSGENHENKMLLLTEPLCDLNTRERLFRDLVDTYGKDAQVIIKPHPRDVLDYRKIFPKHVVLDAKFPMEMLNFLPGVRFHRVVSVFTVPLSIEFADEIIYLGEDFMDKYEEPELHRQNEQIY